jgi:hypothetical protein
MRIILNARALDRMPPKNNRLKLLYRVEKAVGIISGDAEIETDLLTGQDALDFREWMDENPSGWRPARTPATQAKPKERPAAPIKVAPDPITERMYREIALRPQTDQRRETDTKEANDRLIWYHLEQGLTDDRHNATLIAEWLGSNRGYATTGAIDQAIHELRPQLHWKQLSAFTKRLAGI